jgi:hypothetical protein
VNEDAWNLHSQRSSGLIEYLLLDVEFRHWAFARLSSVRMQSGIPTPLGRSESGLWRRMAHSRDATLHNR